MGFPIPGDAIEQSLDLNRYLVHNAAATFFMRVEGSMQTDLEIQPGDLLVVDRSLSVQNQSVIVAVIESELRVLRVLKQGNELIPAVESWDSSSDFSLEVWGVVTTLIRKV